jgi:hypothetical protein
MTAGIRKLALTAHITSSVGWLGAVVAYLSLAVTGLASQDAQMVRAAYLAIELIGWFVIVPCGLLALTTGLIQSLGTPWGLFRHYWIAVKFFLTIPAITILLLHMPAVSRMAGLVAETAPYIELDAPRHPTFVVHAGAGLLVLLAITAISVYKPWGMTPYGRRKQREQPAQSSRIPRSRGVKTLAIALIALLLLLIVLHLAGRHLAGH